MKHHHGPMPYTKAKHLLNPLRKIIQSPRTLVRRLNLEADSRVLELGPGPGYFSAELAHSIPDGRLVLIDIQQEMLDMARKRLEKKGLTNIEYIQSSADPLPVESETMDVAFLVSVLGEVPERMSCLQEIFRVLRTGGLLSVTELKAGDPHFISMPELILTVPDAGFLYRNRHINPFYYTVDFEKP